MGNPEISVCVPAYNRPVTIDRLIRSFLLQDFEVSELVVNDDSTTDSVMDVVASYKDPRIRYRRNPRNIGYCRNLLGTIVRARGKYLLTMGDDDFLISTHALSRYVDVFNAHPDVCFIDCNRLQVSIEGIPDIAFHYFAHDEKFPAGKESITKMLGMAGCISGLGIRNNKDVITSCFPKEIILYPQSKMVGRMLLTAASFAISDFLICVSAHGGLLGYSVNRGQHIHGTEKHGTLEYLEMVEELATELEEPGLKRCVANQLSTALAITLPNEKIYGSTGIALSNALKFIGHNKHGGMSIMLWLSMGGVAVLPKAMLASLQRLAKALSRKKDRRIWEWYAIQYANISRCGSSLPDNE